MSTAPQPPAPRVQPGAEVFAVLRATLANIDNHVEVIRNLLTNTVSHTADMRRRIDALEAGLKGEK